MQQREEERLHLLSRLQDYEKKAEHGRIAVSKFLTPAQKKQAEAYFRGKGNACFWGGYPDAERCLLLVLPDYYASVEGVMPREGENPAESIPDEDANAVRAVKIKGSGFRKLSHRDYLGAMLGMGLERDSIGDIALQSDTEAVVFCTEQVANFLLQTAEKIGADTVKTKPYEVDEAFTDGRIFQPISDTVASPRLDCVVAALTNLSREDAQTQIRTGLVEVDFEPCERTDRMLTPPAELSIRGFGRFRLKAFDGETKKGRLRMVAEKYL